MHVRGVARCAAVLVALGATVPLVAQSLADVAREEQARRKTIAQPSKVYTNKDLGVPPAPTSAGQSSAPPEGGASSDKAGKSVPEAESSPKGADAQRDSSGAATRQPSKDQAYWGGRMKELRTALDRDRTYADALQTRINALTADFTARDDPAQRAVIARDRQKAIDELDRLKKTILLDTRAIADLEEEARRASVPPGWLR